MTAVWVRTESVFVPFRRIDSAPLVADEQGHLWKFDGGAHDPEAPHWCLLCEQPEWRVYNEPCQAAGQLAAANADRDRWIKEHRIDGVPKGANLATGQVCYGGAGMFPRSVRAR